MYYAKEWHMGFSFTEKRINYSDYTKTMLRPIVKLHRFATRKERADFVAEYQPSDYSPSAYVEAVKASDSEVRRELESELQDVRVVLKRQQRRACKEASSRIFPLNGMRKQKRKVNRIIEI